MTTSTSSELTDPRELQDPLALKDPLVLTPSEQREYTRLSNQRDFSTLEKVGLALGAAFLLHRLIMSRLIKEKVGAEPRVSSLRLIADASAQLLMPRWLVIATPALLAGYRFGVKEAKAGTIPEGDLFEIAEAYARQLGEHYNEVSIQALLQGFTAQVNRKVPAARAARMVADAYGVPPRAMNALVSIWNSEDPKRFTSLPQDSVRDIRAKTFIDAQLRNRAGQVAEAEAWSTKSQAKQIVWAWGVERGIIPSDARRVWVTAKDEKVCKSCGPLHRKRVEVGETFDTALGKAWTPPLHVNCRCDVILEYTSAPRLQLAKRLRKITVSKNQPGDPYNRDSHGHFARREARHPAAHGKADVPLYATAAAPPHEEEQRVQEAGQEVPPHHSDLSQVMRQKRGDLQAVMQAAEEEKGAEREAEASPLRETVGRELGRRQIGQARTIGQARSIGQGREVGRRAEIGQPREIGAGAELRTTGRELGTKRREVGGTAREVGRIHISDTVVGRQIDEAVSRLLEYHKTDKGDRYLPFGWQPAEYPILFMKQASEGMVGNGVILDERDDDGFRVGDRALGGHQILQDKIQKAWDDAISDELEEWEHDRSRKTFVTDGIRFDADDNEMLHDLMLNAAYNVSGRGANELWLLEGTDPEGHTIQRPFTTQYLIKKLGLEAKTDEMVPTIVVTNAVRPMETEETMDGWKNPGNWVPDYDAPDLGLEQASHLPVTIVYMKPQD